MRIQIAFFSSLIWICFAANLCLPSAGHSAEMEFKPFITINEEFNDNIFEVSAGKRSELTTRVQPGASYRYQSPFWTWNTTYNFDYRNYARGSRGDEYTHNAMLTGNITLLENFLFLDVSDTYSRVTLDVTHDTATESSLFLNQTDQNAASISPYLVWRLGEKSTLRTGYRYTDTRFWGGGIERHEQGAFADLTREVSSKFNLSANYLFTHLESQPTQYNKHDISGGFRYEYTDRSVVFGQIGNSWQQFNQSGSASFLFWNAGVTHDLGIAMATLETRVQTAVDPLGVSTKETSFSGRFDKTLQRGGVGLAVTYSKYTDTETGGSDRSRLMLNATGRYEIMQSLTANLSAGYDHFSRQAATDYPYRFTGICGLNYALKDNLTLGLTYTYVIYLLDLDTTKDAKEISKAALEIRKAF